jgi:hypothetical protein
MAERSQGTCSRCGQPKAVRDGVVVPHRLTWRVSAKAVPSVGAGKAAVRCQGSGRPPREAS